jgi:hypothetical protein
MGAVVISPLIHWGGMIRSQPRDRPSNALSPTTTSIAEDCMHEGFWGLRGVFNAYFFLLLLSVKDPIGRHCMGGVSVFLDVFGRRIGGCASRYQSTYGLGGMLYPAMAYELDGLRARASIGWMGRMDGKIPWTGKWAI